MVTWVVRAGKNGEQEEDVLKHSVVGIGWEELPDLAGIQTPDELKKLYMQVYPDTTPPSLAQQWSQIWTFLKEIEVDDQVLLPLKSSGTVAIGRVLGEYQYRKDISPRTLHVRAVEWIDRSVPQEQFDEAVNKAFHIPKTVVRVATDTNDSKAWIFQANPEKYRLREAVRSLPELTWLVTSHKMEIHSGDHVYLWESGSGGGIVALATLTSDPGAMPEDAGEIQFIVDPEKLPDDQLKVRLRVDFVLEKVLPRSELIKNPRVAGMQILKFAHGTNFPVTPYEEHELQRLIYGESGKQLPQPVPETLKDWKHTLLRKKQLIFYGPPGTGKTYAARQLAANLISGTKGFSELVQFHPSYAYEDFIQGIRPRVTPDGLTYELEDGRLLEFCRKAEATPEAPCVLIIDEINRANLSKVFGELMYLLEYRDRETRLASGRMFRIPENVYLIGTMNTADRSIALVDHAMRRRFAFVRLMPDYQTLTNFLKDHRYTGDQLVKVLQDLNREINDPDYELGISYFIKNPETLKDNLKDIWVREIEPYLEEYFYDQRTKVAPYRWDSLAKNRLSDWA